MIFLSTTPLEQLCTMQLPLTSLRHNPLCLSLSLSASIFPFSNLAVPPCLHHSSSPSTYISVPHHFLLRFFFSTSFLAFVISFTLIPSFSALYLYTHTHEHPNIHIVWPHYIYLQCYPPFPLHFFFFLLFSSSIHVFLLLSKFPFGPQRSPNEWEWVKGVGIGPNPVDLE